jgi:predicted SAM-dependent methyltransferase
MIFETKLNLGSDDDFLHDRGWLDADIDPKAAHVLKLDVRQEFPFVDGKFDFIYSGHLIEHLEYRQGLHMLRECYRILKLGGVLRITTPDLAVFADWVSGKYGTQVHKYFEYQHVQDPTNVAEPSACHVVNRFVRAWGHSFIYDQVTLHDAFEQAGFRKVTRCAVGESEHEELKNVEPVGRLPHGMYALESQVFEGTKC